MSHQAVLSAEIYQDTMKKMYTSQREANESGIHPPPPLPNFFLHIFRLDNKRNPSIVTLYYFTHCSSPSLTVAKYSTEPSKSSPELYRLYWCMVGQPDAL